MYRKTLVSGTVLALFAAVSLAQSFDVVVVGSGGAGLSAAIMAKEAGSSVVVRPTSAPSSASARAAVAVSPLRAVTAPVTAPPSGLKFFAF